MNTGRKLEIDHQESKEISNRDRKSMKIKTKKGTL